MPEIPSQPILPSVVKTLHEVTQEQQDHLLHVLQPLHDRLGDAITWQQTALNEVTGSLKKAIQRRVNGQQKPLQAIADDMTQGIENRVSEQQVRLNPVLQASDQFVAPPKQTGKSGSDCNLIVNGLPVDIVRPGNVITFPPVPLVFAIRSYVWVDCDTGQVGIDNPPGFEPNQSAFYAAGWFLAGTVTVPANTEACPYLQSHLPPIAATVKCKPSVTPPPPPPPQPPASNGQCPPPTINIPPCPVQSPLPETKIGPCKQCVTCDDIKDLPGHIVYNVNVDKLEANNAYVESKCGEQFWFDDASKLYSGDDAASALDEMQAEETEQQDIELIAQTQIEFYNNYQSSMLAASSNSYQLGR